MTARRDLKRIIRERQKKTGESYTAARLHVMRARAERLDLADEESTTPQPGSPVEAAVLKVNQRSARVQICGEEGQVTFRSGDVSDVVPGHVVTLEIDRRWTWRGDAYGSGRVREPRIDVAKLGLAPLPLEGGELVDVASYAEPYEPPDPYAPHWRRLTATPRPSFRFDGIAWGAVPGSSAEDNPACDAAELMDAGDHAGARRILTEAPGTDLRCLDAHAHLGSLEFERSPRRAILHFEIGVRIGELSLPPGFHGLLVWGHVFNRPFLRCLYGYGACLWRLGRLVEAERAFGRLLSLNPNDNQGARFCWQDLREGRSWEERDEGERSVPVADADDAEAEEATP